MSRLSSKLSSKLRLAEGNRLLFKCPGCKFLHSITYGDGTGYPPEWTWNMDPDKPTFSPSILVTGDYWDPPAEPGKPSPAHQTLVKKVCHSFIRDGQIEFLSDCTHELAGQTVELLDWT